MSLSWIPNAITVLRMLLAPPLAWLILEGRHAEALWLALFAGLSDAVDGLLAKRFGWTSRLGGLLDPIADKLMLLGCFLALGIGDELPAWLIWLVIGRDAVIVSGALAYHRWVGPLEPAPSRLSKLTTVVQIALVLVALFGGLHAITLPAWVLAGTILLVAALTIASGLHYVIAWSAKARRAWQGTEAR
jgi:cardiolipin synthase